MKSEHFHFRRFSVCHSGVAMKVGTDGTLLGALAWPGGARILDVGTGSGLIALMLAQRNANAHITAIDIDANAAECARRNFKMSAWANRLEAIACNIFDLDDGTSYDNIVSNPPFFLSAPAMNDGARRKARIAETLSPFTLLTNCASRLSHDGHLQIIVPAEQAEELIFEGRMHDLHLSRRIDIASREGKAPIRTVVDLCARPVATPTTTLLHLTDADGQRNKDYAQLMSDFYVK